jgi:hypothetical protein
MSSKDHTDLSGLDVIATIESWWGANFNRALIKHILQAPRSHLVEFFSYFWHEAAHTPLHCAGKGTLRPMISNSVADAMLTGDRHEYLTLLPTLALYSHEILVGLPRVFYSDFQKVDDLKELADVLSRILAIKPLFDIGAAQFFFDSGESKNSHPSRALLRLSAVEESEDPEVVEAFSKLATYMSTMDPRTAQRLFFSANNDVSYDIRTATNAPGYFNILKHGYVQSLHLDLLLALSGLTKDRGSQNLNKLLAVEVPGISGMAEQIASLRLRSDEFAEWRSRLGSALLLIDDIDESNDGWASDARATLADELSPITERLKKATKRSPAMEAATSGMRTFSLAGVGTVATGLLGGPIALPAASLATAKAVEAVATYVAVRKKHRANKAVLDVLLAFQGVAR